MYMNGIHAIFSFDIIIYYSSDAQLIELQRQCQPFQKYNGKNVAV